VVVDEEGGAALCTLTTAEAELRLPSGVLDG